MTKSAKSVRPFTSFAHSDDTQPDLIASSRCAQGNISNSVANRKLWHNQRANARVGGTNNDVRAMFSPAGAKLCKVVTREVIGVQHGAAFDRSHIVTEFVVPQSTTTTEPVAPVTEYHLPTLLRRAEMRDMTLVEYCEFANITL